MKEPELKLWLVKEVASEGSLVMKSLFCLNTKAKKLFTKGCADFKRWTLTKHASSDRHCRFSPKWKKLQFRRNICCLQVLSIQTSQKLFRLVKT